MTNVTSINTINLIIYLPEHNPAKSLEKNLLILFIDGCPTRFHEFYEFSVVHIDL